MHEIKTSVQKSSPPKRKKNDKKEKITRCSAKMTNVHGIQIDGNKHVCLHIYLMRYFNSEKKERSDSFSVTQ